MLIMKGYFGSSKQETKKQEEEVQAKRSSYPDAATKTGTKCRITNTYMAVRYCTAVISIPSNSANVDPDSYSFR